MAFSPGASAIDVSVDANAIAVEQFAGDAADLTAPDKVLVDVQGTTDPVSVARVEGPSLRTLPNKAFYATTPGGYQFDAVVQDTGGNILKAATLETRVVDGLRRYLIPDTHVALDVDRPLIMGYDGVQTINVKNGTQGGTCDPVTFQLLKPYDPADPAYSGCGLDYVVGGSSNNVTVTTDDPHYPQALTIKCHIGSTMLWQTDPTGAQYYDLVIPRMGLKFPSVMDRFVMTWIPDTVRIRVWKDYSSHRVPVDTAVLGDNLFKALHQGLSVLSGSFKARLRVVGAKGTLTGASAAAVDTWLTVPSVNDWATYQLDLADSFAANVAGGGTLAPKLVAGVSGSVEAKVPTIPPVEAQVSREVSPPPAWNGESLPPPPAYNFMSIKLDPDGQFILHTLPLAINPADIPTVPGFPTVIPLDLYILDTSQPGASVDCPLPIFMQFKHEASEFGILDPWTQDPTDTPSRRAYGPQFGNPMKTNVVYRTWLVFHGQGTVVDATVQFNGVDFTTFTFKPIDLSQATFPETARWVALGNFAHLADVEPIETSALHRAAYAVNQAQTFAIELGNAEHVSAYIQYGFGGSANKSEGAAALLGSGNWMGAIDDWMPKAQDFLDANGIGCLESTAAFAAATNEGRDWGLPFGVFSAHYTGGPKFDCNRNVLSVVMAYHWADYREGDALVIGGGMHTSATCALDWAGKARIVGVVVGPQTDITLANGVWDAMRLATSIWGSFDMDQTDAYWCDITVNGRGYAEADPLDPDQAYWWQTRTAADGSIWTPTYTDPPGYKSDGFALTPYLTDYKQLKVWDPLSADEAGVVDITTLTGGSYDKNQELSGSFASIIPGFLYVNKAQQIHRASFLEQIHNWSTFRMNW